VERFAHVGLTDEEFLLAVHGLDKSIALGVATENTGAVARFVLGLVLPALALYEPLSGHVRQDVAKLEVGVVVFNAQALGNVVGTVALVRMLSQIRENVLAEAVGLCVCDGDAGGS
jgi:hypothetical protein